MRRRFQCGRRRGFSLLEALVATALMIGLGAVAFKLFHQSERLFRDQSLILEMQQGARLIVSQVTADIRMAGQGLPPGITEIILPGTNTSRLNLRTCFSAVESVVVSLLPLSVTAGTASTLNVESTSGFSAGREAFLWTDLAWARGSIDSVSGSAKTVRITPATISGSPLDFVTPPTLSLDEAVAIYWDASMRSIRRTTAISTQNPASLAWAPANELATNVTSLVFLYADASGIPVIPDTAQRRSEIASIEIQVTVRSSAPLSDGSQPAYTLSGRAYSRNMNLR